MFGFICLSAMNKPEIPAHGTQPQSLVTSKQVPDPTPNIPMAAAVTGEDNTVLSAHMYELYKLCLSVLTNQSLT